MSNRKVFLLIACSLMIIAVSGCATKKSTKSITTVAVISSDEIQAYAEDPLLSEIPLRPGDRVNISTKDEVSINAAKVYFVEMVITDVDTTRIKGYVVVSDDIVTKCVDCNSVEVKLADIDSITVWSKPEATVESSTLPSFDDTKVCCESVEEFQYESIGIGESQKLFMHKEYTQAFLFDSGKSYFKAFELPDWTQSYHAKIESYPMQPTSPYLFYPILMTLDKNFNVVRTSDPGANQPISSFDSIFTGVRYKLTTQLPFTSKNKDEKYLIILTTDELSAGKSRFSIPNSPLSPALSSAFSFLNYYFAVTIPSHPWPKSNLGRKPYIDIKNSIGGTIAVSLLSPPKLIEDISKKLLKSHKEVDINKQYEDDWVTVLPPQKPNYKFQHKSVSFDAGKIEVSYLTFKKFEGGAGVRLDVFNSPLGLYYRHLSADTTLVQAMRDTKNKYEETLNDVKYEASKVRIDGIECHRFDYFGKSKEILFLPTRGYNVLCIHPDWAEKRHPLIVNIAASYIYPLDEPTESLPGDLKGFYKNVRFKRTEESFNKTDE